MHCTQTRTYTYTEVNVFSSKALRVLAIAYQPFPDKPPKDDDATLENNLTLLGLVASIDPERKEVAQSIRQSYSAGIRVVMITGDYVKTAKAIAENIGLLPRGSKDTKAIDCAIIRVFVL